MDARPNRREALAAIVAASGWADARRLANAEELFPSPPSSDAIRVLFFNTHLLPAIAQSIAGHRGQDEYRTRAIAAQLHQYHLVGLCEAFEAHRRKQIVDAVQQNSGNAYYWIESPPPTGRALICGGLLLLSRFPIVDEPHVLTYASASRVLTNGIKADGLAAKGVLHARLRIAESPDVLADCFLTHLESISGKARAEQVKELAGFVAAHASPDRPTILMGDLNVAAAHPAAPAPAGSEYRLLTDALRQNDDNLVDAWPALHSDRGDTNDPLAAKQEGRRIDYIFLSPLRRERNSWEPIAIRVEPFLDAKIEQGSLSDHAGVACELALRRGGR